MKVVISIPNQALSSYDKHPFYKDIEVIRVESSFFFKQYPFADLYIDTVGDDLAIDVNAPLLIHAPSLLWSQLVSLPKQCAKACFWPGFFNRQLWEIAPNPDSTVDWVMLLNALGIKALILPDAVGLVSARILATIINEAVFCLAENTANCNDIDIAMKLGTNYPLGPIEWAKKIEARQVFNLLQAMAKTDNKYTPHPRFMELLNT